MKYFLIILAITLSLLSLFLCIFKFEPIEVSTVSYIGAIGTMVAIAVTVLVGFQIYRAYEVKKDLNDFREALQEVEKLKNSLTNFEFESRGTFHLIVGGVLSNDHSACLDSFINVLRSIPYFLKCGYSNMDGVLDDLKEAVTFIQPGFIILSTVEETCSNIDNVMGIAKDIDKEVRSLKIFHSIDRRYTKIMKAFYLRMERCKVNEAVASDEYSNIASL